jgi:hypothetical protein
MPPPRARETFLGKSIKEWAAASERVPPLQHAPHTHVRKIQLLAPEIMRQQGPPRRLPAHVRVPHHRRTVVPHEPRVQRVSVHSYADTPHNCGCTEPPHRGARRHCHCPSSSNRLGHVWRHVICGGTLVLTFVCGQNRLTAHKDMIIYKIRQDVFISEYLCTLRRSHRYSTPCQSPWDLPPHYACDAISYIYVQSLFEELLHLRFQSTNARTNTRTGTRSSTRNTTTSMLPTPTAAACTCALQPRVEPVRTAIAPVHSHPR